MTAIWVVAADSSRARILETRNPFGGLREVEAHDHARSRLHGGDLTTDGPGRAFNRMAPGRHAMEQAHDVKEHEAEVFARRLAARLERAEREGRFQRLVIAAAPRFLGHLRACLPRNVKRRVAGEVSKDLVKQDVRRLRGSLPERL